jgi:hypothetical protein
MIRANAHHEHTGRIKGCLLIREVFERLLASRTLVVLRDL